MLRFGRKVFVCFRKVVAERLLFVLVILFATSLLYARHDRLSCAGGLRAFGKQKQENAIA
jgi:hypothetical protein